MNKSSLKRKEFLHANPLRQRIQTKTLSTYISKANQLPNWPENMALAIQQFISGSRARPKLNPVNRQTNQSDGKATGFAV
ncbi:hypothetical protein [Lacticaseibacillus paracasei]|uniref:hypothetical protein n=1 Tax=Lacticaseibacillus paracasei TaxID=1597 RepID=UPI0024782E1A|nr:hypothetical protein [Lacticaseibacillus paracasei]MDH7443969.1 hypothetical protein [Lacticaseibacillus paracasei subsp. paracasei]